MFGDEEGPGFSYTTGFWLKLNFPEIITFSLKREIAHDTFWRIYRTLEQGERFAIGAPIDSIFESSHAALLPVSKRTTRIISAGVAGSTTATISIACNSFGRIAADSFLGNKAMQPNSSPRSQT